MRQAIALEILCEGESALLTGPAGTGKTHLLNKFIQIAKAEGKKVSVPATTGLAATHLGGATIHAWSGIGIADELRPGFADHMSKTRREIIEKTDILIIDEISMLHDFRLDMIDETCRLVRKKDEPFGGIQIVMSGDFFQLPPVNRREGRTGGFVVNSNVWQELDPTVLYLDEQFRQDDEQLLGILTAMRDDDIRRHHVESLLARAEVTPSDPDGITELHTVNIDVDSINHAKLQALTTEEVSFSQFTTGSQNYVDTLQRSVLAPQELTLRKGALVMAVKNSPQRTYVNGSIGTVVDFEPGTEYPVVEFRSGRTITMVPESWELRDGDKKRASISQIPLRLAWAITVHKSQGMTLDAARIDLRKAFVPGMGYVALSRVKNIDNLYLYGINRTALTISEDALAIDSVLRDKTKRDSERFAHLEERAEQRAKEALTPAAIAKKQSSSGWSEKIAKMRETYPNAYRPWKQQDDALLKEEFHGGKTIPQLSSLLGRHEGSVRMRLQKHFGEDVVS